MKKLLGLALIFISYWAHGQASPAIINDMPCGNASGVLQPCGNTLPSGFVVPYGNLPSATGPYVVGNTSTGTPINLSAVVLSSGVSGGIPCWTASNVLTSSAALAAGQFIVGGGAGVCPTTQSINPNGSVTNTALGSGAAGSVTGTGVTAFGDNALGNSTTGNSNTAFGYLAGNYISTGQNNLAFGALSMQGTAGAPTTGNSNTAVGANAMNACQGACGNNTAVGQAAGSTITTGTFNVILGNAVCSNSSTCLAPSNSVFIGTNNSCIPSVISPGNEYDLCMGSSYVLRITGGGTPATSKALFAGSEGVSTSFYVAGTQFTVATSTGACATTTITNGGATGGEVACTGTAGASTLVVNLPTIPTGLHDYMCFGQDATSGVAWAQKSISATTCTLSGTIATTSDHVTWFAVAY